MGNTFRLLGAGGVDAVSTSRACWPVRNSASRKSTKAFGSSASCTTISATSTWSRKPCNPSTTRSARGCHPCLRYVLLPMSPGWTTVSLAVGAVCREPVSLLFAKYQGDFRKKQRTGGQKCQKDLRHRHFSNIASIRYQGGTGSAQLPQQRVSISELGSGNMKITGRAGWSGRRAF